MEQFNHNLRIIVAALICTLDGTAEIASQARFFNKTVRPLKIIRLPGLSAKHTWWAFSILGGLV